MAEVLVALRSRAHIAPFTLHRPGSWGEAKALHDASPAAAYLAGGLDLIDWLKQGHELRDVIRLDGIPGFDAIEVGSDGVRVGAGVTLAALAAHGGVPFGALSGVASPRVRLVGTIGGNVMSRHPDYDCLPALLACDAFAELADGERVPVADLFAMSGPLVAAFHVPFGFVVRADRSLRPALSVWVGVSGARRRVAVGMAYAPAVCIEGVGAEFPVCIDDGRASAVYRRRMIGVLSARLS